MLKALCNTHWTCWGLWSPGSHDRTLGKVELFLFPVWRPYSWHGHHSNRPKKIKQTVHSNQWFRFKSLHGDIGKTDINSSNEEQFRLEYIWWNLLASLTHWVIFSSCSTSSPRSDEAFFLNIPILPLWDYRLNVKSVGLCQSSFFIQSVVINDSYFRHPYFLALRK